MSSVTVVWFKRDLRLNDHVPIVQAVTFGFSLLFLYILGRELWHLADTSRCQYDFFCECIRNTQQALAALGHTLVIRVGGILYSLRRSSQYWCRSSIFLFEQGTLPL